MENGAALETDAGGDPHRIVRRAVRDALAAGGEALGMMMAGALLQSLHDRAAQLRREAAAGDGSGRETAVANAQALEGLLGAGGAEWLEITGREWQPAAGEPAEPA